MALYSWFLRTKNTKTVSTNNNLMTGSESAKYSGNYTMWPTVKIKQEVKVALPNFNHSESKLPTQHKAALTTKTGLVTLKS